VSEIDYGARARLDHIEKQLQVLFPDSYVSFAVSNTTGMPATVVEFARNGNLIGAIKEYRRITGVGLAEAKKAVEGIR
jgi:ribosomal protein L7/L12